MHVHSYLARYWSDASTGRSSSKSGKELAALASRDQIPILWTANLHDSLTCQRNAWWLVPRQMFLWQPRSSIFRDFCTGQSSHSFCIWLASGKSCCFMRYRDLKELLSTPTIEHRFRIQEHLTVDFFILPCLPNNYRLDLSAEPHSSVILSIQVSSLLCPFSWACQRSAASHEHTQNRQTQCVVTNHNPSNRGNHRLYLFEAGNVAVAPGRVCTTAAQPEAY